MATFAEKVRGPSQGIREHQQTSATTTVSTEDIEEDLVEAITIQNGNATIHPTQAREGESLPAGYSRSYGGFLLRHDARLIPVDQHMVRREMEYLSRHVLLAYFVGGRPPQHSISPWLELVQRQVGGYVAIGRNLGRGFFQLRAKDFGIVQKLLTLTPFKSRWGNCVMQNWVPNFNSANPKGMKIPTWITLRRVPDEFQCVARQIAEGLGEVLGGDKKNSTLEDQRFCIALTAGDGWATTVDVVNGVTGEQSSIIIDYTNLPIRCRFCFETIHKAKDCPALATLHQKTTSTSPTAGQSGAPIHPPPAAPKPPSTLPASLPSLPTHLLHPCLPPPPPLPPSPSPSSLQAPS